MKTIMITSSKFAGELEFRYQEGLLMFFENRAVISTAELQWVHKNMPMWEDDVELVIKKTQTLKATEIKREITFDMFWDKYDHKSISNRKKSETRWKRMSKAQQAKALYFIDKYFASIPHGVAKKYAETYLNSELWDQ
jgi:hypothetical protein